MAQDILSIITDMRRNTNFG